jgi:hypothetical protein
MTTALEGGKGSASLPGRSLLPEKTRYPSDRRLGGTQERCGQVRKISPPPGLDPRTAQPVARSYTDWATRPPILRKRLKYYEIVAPILPYEGLVGGRHRNVSTSVFPKSKETTEFSTSCLQRTKFKLLFGVTYKSKETANCLTETRSQNTLSKPHVEKDNQWCWLFRNKLWVFTELVTQCSNTFTRTLSRM